MKTPHRVLPLLLLYLTACATASLPDRGTLVMRDVKFPLRELRYASGLRILVEEDKRRPVVAVVSLVGSGGANDSKGKEGLAHLVEHLTFRARSPERPSRWGQLEAAGAGRLNAYTSFDVTAYHAVAPRESLPELLRIEGERLSAPLAGVTPEVFTVEREVVRNELRQRNETGFVGQVFSYLQAASFPEGHPYARPVVGSHESLSALTLADAQRFVRQEYKPDNTTLVISGDVDLATVDQLVAQHLPAALLGSGPPLQNDPRLSATPPAVPLAPSAGLIEREAAVPTPELYLGWTLPRGYDAASYLHDFVESTLPGELYRATGVDGDIAGLSTVLIPGKRASLLVVRVVLRSGEHPQKSANTVLDQLYRLWSDQTDVGDVMARERDLRRQQLSAVVGMALESEDLLERAVRRAELSHFTLDPLSYSRSLKAVANLKGGDITRFAYEYLQRDRARMVLVRPTVGGAATASAGSTAPVALEEDAPSSGPLLAPLPVSAFRTVLLENGLEVVLASTPGAPVATVTVLLHGGTATGTPRGVAELAELLAYPERRLNGIPGDYGLRQGGGLGQDQTVARLSGAAGNLPNMLAILSEQLSTQKTSEEYVNFFREQILPYLETAESWPEARASRAFRAALYGSHPYGTEARAADYKAVGERQIEAWVDRVYQPGNAVVAIVGELDLDEAERQARVWLSRWRGTAGALAAPSAAVPEHAPKPVQLVVTGRPGASQTQVSWGCVLPEADAASAARHEVMAELARTRLYRQVRSALGASYGFHGVARVYDGGSAHLEVHGAVENAQLAQALTAVRRTLEELAAGRLQPGELESARRRLQLEYAFSLGTSQEMAAEMVRIRGLGWPLSAMEAYPRHLEAVTPTALQQDFTTCANGLVLSLVGDETLAREAAQGVWARRVTP